MAKHFQQFTINGGILDELNKANGKPGASGTHQYEASVLGMLHSFQAIQTSRALLKAFSATRGEVLIFPWDGDDACQAEADSADLLGNRVFFTPNNWFASSPCFREGPAGNSAHEVLFHELCHAFRFNTKKLRAGAIPDEERIAVLITNIFSSETHRPLRKSHDDFTALTDPVLITSSGFLHANHRLLSGFVKDHKDLSQSLAKVNAPFNPLRAYFDLHHRKH